MDQNNNYRLAKENKDNYRPSKIVMCLFDDFLILILLYVRDKEVRECSLVFQSKDKKQDKPGFKYYFHHL